MIPPSREAETAEDIRRHAVTRPRSTQGVPRGSQHLAPQRLALGLPVVVVALAMLLWPQASRDSASTAVTRSTSKQDLVPKSTTSTTVVYTYVEGILTIGGQDFQVGEADDLIAIGDWARTGQDTVASLRPRTGEVFVFDSWPQSEEISSRPIGIVPDAIDLAGVKGSNHCGEILVQRRAGRPSLLKVKA